MKNKLRQRLSILLALIMVLSMIPASVFAEDDIAGPVDAQETTDQEEANVPQDTEGAEALPEGSAEEAEPPVSDEQNDEQAPADDEVPADDEAPAEAETPAENEASEAPAAPAKAPEDDRQRSLTVRLTEFDGVTAVSNATIGSGVELVYYEMPLSALGERGLIDLGSQERMLETYRHTTTLTRQETSLVINMEEDATPENPYILWFMGEGTPFSLYMGGFSGEWAGYGAIRYDGTTAEIYYPENMYYNWSYSTVSTINRDITGDSNNGFILTVRHDDSLFHPKFNLSFNSNGNEGVYPITIGTYKSDGTFETSTIGGDMDGVYESPSTMSRKLLEQAFSEGGSYKRIDVPLFFLTNADKWNSQMASWDRLMEQNGKTYVTAEIKSVGEDGMLYVPDNYSSYTSYEAYYRFYYVTEGGRPALKIRMQDLEELCPDEELPVHMYVQAYSWGPSGRYIAGKQVEITKEDLNKDLLIKFDKVDPDLTGDYSIYFSFNCSIGRDAEMTGPAINWGDDYNPGSAYCSGPDHTVDEDGYWCYGRIDQNGQIGPLVIPYRKMSVKLPVESYSVEDSYYPLYLKASLGGKESVLKISENGKYTMDLGVMGLDDFNHRAVSWTVYKDEECTQVYEDWGVDSVSENVYWNSSERVLYSENNYQPFSIPLSKVTSKTISVQMETDFSASDASEYLPVVMTAELLDGSGAKAAEVTETLTAPEDATRTIVFTAPEGEDFAGDGQYTVRVSFSQSGESGAYENWLPAQAWGTLWKEGKLLSGVSEMKLSFAPVTVDVKPDAFRVEVSDSHPIYAKTWIGIDGEPYRSIDSTLTSEDQFKVDFKLMGLIGGYYDVRSILNESEDSEDLGWDVTRALTTVGTMWYSDQQIGKLSGTGTLIGAGNGDTVVLKPYEGKKTFTQVDVPIHFNIPDGYYVFQGHNNILYAAMRLKHLDNETGDIQYITCNYNQTRIDNGSYVQNYTYVRDYRDPTPINKTMTVYMNNAEPGEYYLDYELDQFVYSDGASFGFPYSYWTVAEGIKVVLTEDGELLFAEGENEGKPVTLEYYYKYADQVVPHIDVLAEYPEGYDMTLGNNYSDETEDTPEYFTYSLSGPCYTGERRVYLRTGADPYGVIEANVPEGESEISSPQRRYAYFSDFRAKHYNPDYESTWNDKVVVDGVAQYYGDYEGYTNWQWNVMMVYNYPNASGMPVGDYTLTYTTGAHTAVKEKWESAKNVRVHLDSDGHLYEIDENGNVSEEPYVIHIRKKTEEELPVIKTFDSIKIHIKTTLEDGVDPETAFTEGDTFVASVTKAPYQGEVQRNFLIGTARIDEEGTIDLELKRPDGSPFVLEEYTGNYNYETRYYLSYGTFHDFKTNFDDSENVNNCWPFYDQDYEYYTYNWSSGEVPYYFLYTDVDEEGYVRGYQYTYNEGDELYSYANRVDKDQEDLLFQNYSLILPWSETDPGEISQGAADGDNTVLYKPITTLSAIKEKGNYIIVVQNRSDGKWYALYYDEKGGYSIELKDVDSFEDLENGYRVDTSDSSFGGMILQASKLNVGSGSVSMQLKTSVVDENGKTISIKMGQSNSEPTPLMSSSAGTVIVQSAGNGMFNIKKGSYAQIYYLDDLFGRSEFKTISTNYGNTYVRPNGEYSVIYGLRNSKVTDRYYNHSAGTSSTPMGGAVGFYAGVNSRDQINTFMVDIDKEKYMNDEYLNKLASLNEVYPGIGQSAFYILSDDIEAQEQENLTQYTLVKTFGDFEMTFNQTTGKGAASKMVLVYKDEDGREWAMEPGGLFEVATKAGGSGYRTLKTVADHELRPNNNSGTSDHFSIAATEVSGEGCYVFATPYAFRKGVQNTTANLNYLTLNGSAWTKNDDTTREGLVYVLHPDNTVYSQADWNNAETYKLEVIRSGSTAWLGVGTDENGNKIMTAVSSEEEAASFSIYSDVLRRYYASAYGTDLYKYIKVNDITEINANDEILIVYNDNGQRKIVGAPFYESYNQYGQIYYYSWTPAVNVLDEYSEVDVRQDELGIDTRYSYRLGTDEYIKKPFAYIDQEDESIIWAQGVAANAIGNAKTENKKQRKYESVVSLNMNYGTAYFNIKADRPTYYYQAAETNFFPGPEAGLFYIRGGKSTTWLGAGTYSRTALNLDTGIMEQYDNYRTFVTVPQDERIAVEVYRRPASDDVFTVDYRTPEGEEDHKETKPKDTFTLTQKQETEHDGKTYIFVGWTTKEEYGGYLTREMSANLYDYDDLSKVASVKKDIQETYGLLGDCNPEVSNLIDYPEVEDSVVNDVLTVWPVYAEKGFSAAVAANDGDTMIVGASDFKDLQNSGSGAIQDKEIWLGSINIEVYLDGELWVPGEGGSTIGPRHVRRRAGGADSGSTSATLYFAYHNDNAADLNIKFIAESVTADTLYEYMSSPEFKQTEPTQEYLIDAVYAEQGGSEDGLRYRYNWMTDDVGGQLDNVKGGSTVKIYVTSKYQVKYFFDNGDGKGYQELTGDKWQDDGYYMTPGTDNAVNACKEEADYFIEPDGEYPGLIERTPQDGTSFKDAKIERGEYQKFLYKFAEYPHVIPIAELPSGDLIPAGKELEGEEWTIRGEDMSAFSTQAPSTDFGITGTSYGTGNTIWSYTGAKDETHTYHLYIKVLGDNEYTDLIIKKNMPERIDASSEGFNSTAVFEVTGYDKDENVVYRNHVGIAFDNNSGASESKELSKIPMTAVKITVKEVYAGNYVPQESEITKTELEEVDGRKIWTFEFTNLPGTSTGSKGGAIVNEYEFTEEGIRFKGAEGAVKGGGAE